MKIIYSQKHYEWLIEAGLWPSSKKKGPMPRMQMIGDVIETDDQTILVQWHHNNLYRERFKNMTRLRPGTIYRHFKDNLQILE